jgi:hypothetical protein
MGKPGNRRRDALQECVHHWLCGDEERGVVHAVCAKCGAETDFAQHAYPFKWDKKDISYLFSVRVRE